MHIMHERVSTQPTVLQSLTVVAVERGRGKVGRRDSVEDFLVVVAVVRHAAEERRAAHLLAVERHLRKKRYVMTGCVSLRTG